MLIEGKCYVVTRNGQVYKGIARSEGQMWVYVYNGVVHRRSLGYIVIDDRIDSIQEDSSNANFTFLLDTGEN